MTVLAGVQSRLTELALAGDSNGANALITQVVKDGTSIVEVIESVLSTTEHDIGERWHENRCTVVDEHVATGVIRMALECALSIPRERSGARGLVAVACAEGDWHGLAARLQAELLSAAGWTVRYMGASAPADQVQRYLARKLPTALIVTCSYPLAFAGAARLAECAHAVGVPVLIGGRAVTPLYLADRLGADGDPTSLEGVGHSLDSWAQQPPTTFNAPRVRFDAELARSEIDRISSVATEVLSCRLSSVECDERWRARSLEDFAQVVRFACAAHLVDTPDVFFDFLTWRSRYLAVRGVPSQEILMGVTVLHELLGDDMAVGDRGEAMAALATTMGSFSGRARR